MEIRGYLKTSLIEWPGEIASVVWVAGCNFRCPFCHNRDLVLASPSLPVFSEAAIFADLEKRKKWIDGVAVTGGEPTLQPDLADFLVHCRRLGLKTMLETNGSLFVKLREILSRNLVDYLAMDFKGPLDRRYLEIVGLDRSQTKILANIRRSLALVLTAGINFEFRTTVVPGLHDQAVLTEMAKQLKEIVLKTGSRTTDIHWYLQNFQPKNCLDPKMEKVKPYRQSERETFLKVIKKYFPQAALRTS